MMRSKNLALALAMGVTATLAGAANPVQAQGERVSVSQKGSLLIYSNVELRWDANGDLVQDTILELTNDITAGTNVQMYFVNGDEPRDAVFGGNPPVMIAEGEPGWNFTDLQTFITQDQPIYWSAATGQPLGAAPFSILDPSNGNGPGRPTADGGRMLRGFVYVWAVNNLGHQVRWNHLSGSATIVDYAAQTAWEYNAWAFQSNVPATNGQAIGIPGELHLDGIMYESAFDALLMSFYSSGSQALSSDLVTASIDTDLTIHAVSADFSFNSRGPVTTDAKFDIWNQSEQRFSGTHRCITCWDQTLLSNYDAPNHFLIGNLGTDKGKARIDGVQNNACDSYCGAIGELDKNFYSVCSQPAAILGVISKEIAFSGAADRRARSGRSLVGMGVENADIYNDIIAPPGELRDEAFGRIGALDQINGDDTRTYDGSKRTDRSTRQGTR